MELDGVSPTIGRDVWLAPTAVLVGDVRVGDNASIWFGAVLRGDSSTIHIGAGASVQDNALVHCAKDLPTVVGEDVDRRPRRDARGLRDRGRRHRGDGRHRPAARAPRRRSDARGRRRALRALGVAAGMLAAGVPAREKKPLSGSAQAWTQTAAGEYQHYRRRYLTASAVIEGS